MGQLYSSGDGEKINYKEFIANYQFLRKIRDARYGDISILEDKETKEQVALKEILSKNTRDFEKDLGFLKLRQAVIHPNIIKVFGHTSKAEDNLCASFYKIFLIVEFLDSDLEREITLKKNHNQIYTEEQLWYLIECSVNGLTMLQQNSIYHGDLKPSSVLVSKMGVYKIAEHNVIGNALSAYHQKLSGSNDSRNYLSPQLMSSLRKAEMKPRHNPWKSDVFSLGITLLHAATLSNCDRVYDWDNCSIDKESLQMKLDIIQSKYSPRFLRFVKEMLIFDEDTRPDFIDLERRLSEPIKNERLNPTTNHMPLSPPKHEESDDEPSADFLDSVRDEYKLEQASVRGPSIRPSVKAGVTTAYNEIRTSVSSIPDNTDRNRGYENPITALKENLKQSIITSVPRKEKDLPTLSQNDYSVTQTTKERNDLSMRLTNTSGRENTFPEELRDTKETEGDNIPLKMIRDNGIDPIGSLTAPETDSLFRKQDKIYIPSTTEPIPQSRPFDRNEIVVPPKPDYIEKSYARPENDSKIQLRPAISYNEPEKKQKFTPPQLQNDILLETKHTEPDADLEKRYGTVEQNIEDQELHPDPNLSREVAKIISEYKKKTETSEPSIVKDTRVSYSNHFLYQPSTEVSRILQEMKGASNFNSISDIAPLRDLQFPNQSGYSSNYESNQKNINDPSFRPNPEIERIKKEFNKTQNISQALQQSTIEKASVPTYNNYSNYEPLGSESNSKRYDQRDYNENNIFHPKYEDRSNASWDNRRAEQSKSSPEAYKNSQIFDPLRNTNKSTYTRDERSYSNIQKSPEKDFEYVSETYADGSIYEGQKKNGLRHGKGKFYYSDGGMYHGDWYQGSMEGFGILYYAGGSKAYEGSWKDDKFHGKGTVYNEAPLRLNGEFDYSNFDNVSDHWMRYEGDFLNDNKEGLGILVLTNGDKYQGQFKEDMVHGHGNYFTSGGQVIQGEWWQNRIVRTF